MDCPCVIIFLKVIVGLSNYKKLIEAYLYLLPLTGGKYHGSQVISSN